jgi:1-acyl-sn-glycerol-3-phosphate acyltransferase
VLFIVFPPFELTYFCLMIIRLTRLAKILFSVYASIWLLILLVLVFPLTLFSYVLPPKKRSLYLYRLIRWGFDFLYLVWGMRHESIYEEEHDSQRPYIFVYNHISYIDAIVILKAIRKQDLRGLGKAEPTSIPLFGFIYKTVVITVKRNDPVDRARCVADMKKAVQDNISIILAPEGTFNMSNNPLAPFYDGAFKIAIETQTPIRPLLFLDSYHRMHYNSIFSMTPGQSRVVFLKSFSTKGMTMEQLPELREAVYQHMESSLIKYRAPWIKNS